MMRLLSLFLLTSMLCACDGRNTAAVPAPPQPTSPAPSAPAPAAEPEDDLLADPPATAPSAPRRQARFDGYGALRFGMSEAQVRAAWAGELEGFAPAEGSTCFYLSPPQNRAPADFALMFEEGRLVRYDIGTAHDVAPGGGAVGMQADRIRSLYAERLDEQPHHYIDGGRYLRVRAPEEAAGVIVFEADAEGRIARWRAGLPPQVDYVEGCS